MRFVPFTAEFIEKAAHLLAKRHQRERKVLASLPANFEAAEVALKAVESVWKMQNAIGVAAFRGDEMVGYMIGHHTSDLYKGRSGTVKYPGLAIADGESEELYRQLYASFADEWVKKGYYNHFVFAPAGNPLLIDAWLRLGFAYQQTYALLDLAELEEKEVECPQGIEVIKITSEHRELLRSVSAWISTHQSRVPAWSPIYPETVEEMERGFTGIVDDDEAQGWFAMRDGEVVAYHVYWVTKGSDTEMLIPEGCVELGVAATKPTERGRGVGTFMTEYCLREMKKQGYRYCQTDWHVLNLLSSNFWPKQGFVPVSHRLYRRVDERIAWARL